MYSARVFGIVVFLLFLLFGTDSRSAALHADGFEPVCATDIDNDRLSECIELDLGTDPLDADTDDDGLTDGDEVLGTLGGLPLPAYGVSALRKDLLVEIDWIEGSECVADGFTRRPTAENVAMLEEMFAGVAIINPDGSYGIHLVIDYGQGDNFGGGGEIDAPDALLDGVFTRPTSEFRNTRDAHFDANRIGYFHYGIVAWRFDHPGNLASGVAELGGDDFIVALGCSSNDFIGAVSYANTIAHELGHNLGLLHGGADECNFRPNYNSVMNYRYQFGSDTSCDGFSDYEIGAFSAGTRPSLDEADLDENRGVCGHPAVDLNFNGLIESHIVRDLNSDDGNQASACGGTLTLLEDTNDGALMSLGLIANADANEGVPLQHEVVCTALPQDASP